MKTINLKADKREILGRKVKKLRKEGKTPGSIYGNKFKSESISFDTKEFKSVFKEAGETNLVEISLGKDKYTVLIHETQKHPVTDDILHVDFFKVNLSEKIKANVPVDVVGESPAEKQGLGAVVKHIDEIEVECLPADIPDVFEVDVTSLSEVDQMIQVKDIKADKNKVVIVNDPDEIVVKIEPLTKVEEILVPTPAEGTEESAVAASGTDGTEAAQEEAKESSVQEK
jgi:large subunit ribosomal protein L25